MTLRGLYRRTLLAGFVVIIWRDAVRATTTIRFPHHHMISSFRDVPSCFSHGELNSERHTGIFDHSFCV